MKFKVVLSIVLTLSCSTLSFSDDTLVSSPSAVSVSSPVVSDLPVIVQGPDHIRSIHVTAWMAGSKKQRAYLNDLLDHTIINSLTIDIKEEEGLVFIPGVKTVEKIHAYEKSAIPDLPAWLAELKKRKIHTVGRIVVFKDNMAPAKMPEMAVHNPEGGVWRDHKKISWLDPYNAEARRYNLLIAIQAAKLGFDEIQFDYIRFPTDGAVSQMRFARPYSRAHASEALVDFLTQARQLLNPLGTKISIDVFGLTTSVQTGMGIGQLLKPMSEQVDYVCPMIYPSHYYGGEYGIKSPNAEPYKMIYHALKDAIKLLGPENAHKLRPYLQDFTIRGLKGGAKVHYGVKEVRAQIQAAADLGVQDFSLWNASVRYTRAALLTLAVPAPQPSATLKTDATAQVDLKPLASDTTH